MKTESGLHTCTALLLVFLASHGAAFAAESRTNDGPGMLFLNLKVQADQSVKLLSSVARPGVLKPSANADSFSGIHYDLLDKGGKSLWHAAIPDPTHRVLEHLDRSESRKLVQSRVEMPNAEFMVRVPALSNAVRVAFYRWSKTATNEALAKIHLGEVPLPLK